MPLRTIKASLGRRYRQTEGRLHHLLLERGLPHDTSPRIRLRELGVQAEGGHRYQASPWTFLPRALRGETVHEDDVFLELGCGLGRVVYQAARRYPYRRVIGVDIAADLVLKAQENIAAARPRLRARDVELVAADVTEYDIPDDVTHVYLFNPFLGPVLETVVANLVASLDRRPRVMTVLYAFPQGLETFTATGRFRVVRESRGLRRKLATNRILVLKGDPGGA